MLKILHKILTRTRVNSFQHKTKRFFFTVQEKSTYIHFLKKIIRRWKKEVKFLSALNVDMI